MPSSTLRIAEADSVKRAWSVRLCASREASMLAIGASSFGEGSDAMPRARGLEGLHPGDLRRQPQHLAQVPGDADQQHQHDEAVEERIVGVGAEQDRRQRGGHDEHRHQEDRHADQIDVGPGHCDWLLAPASAAGALPPNTARSTRSGASLPPAAPSART